MSPTPARIGPYLVERELARGGMGIVYLARDTRLDRTVALKALPEDFTSDPERVVRFEREAKVLASLSHPNIAGIYGVETSEGRRYLALERVEGSTLGERLLRGPLPLTEALEICIQIAAGLEAAHETGVIHRDLKPGNVMVTPGDQVKIVDFGLAKGKVADPPTGTPDSPTITESPALAYSPTMGGPATLPGVILGTAAYLSPEQARGKPVDRRTDIWSFGCVLYECLTGKRAFEGETISDLISRILQSDVDWARLSSAPPRLRELLRRCLAKDPRKRLRDVGDARLLLEEIRDGVGEPPTARAGAPRAFAIWAAVLGIIGGASAMALWNGLGPGGSSVSQSREVKRLSIMLPNEIEHSIPGISPDGRFLVVSGRPRTKPGEEPARYRVYRRSIDGFEWQMVDGSEGNGGLRCSPDGKWLYFYRQISDRSTESQLVKAPMGGGAAPVAVATIDPAWGNSCPLNNGDVLFTTAGGSAYVRVSGDKALASAPIKFHSTDLTPPYAFAFVQPGDRDLLVTSISREAGRYVTCIGLLDPESGEVTTLVRDGDLPVYSRTGHLLFSRGSALLAMPIDLRARRVNGRPVAVLDGLRPGSAGQSGYFRLSRDGTLVFAPGGMIGLRRRIAVADASGRVTAWGIEQRAYGGSPAVSLDGRSIAVSITNANVFDEIWVATLASHARRIVSVTGADCYSPVWSPDGRQIAFARLGSNRDDGVYIQDISGGSPRRVCSSDSLGATYQPTSWSRDGSTLLVTRTRGGNSDICRVSVATSELMIPLPLVDGPALESSARYSPDGRLIAFESNESGRKEVYVATIGVTGAIGVPILASAGGGSEPRWGPTTGSLFYETPQRQIVSVSISVRSTLASGTPVPRWDLEQLNAPMWNSHYEVMAGDRLLLIQQGEEEGPVTRLDVVLNFFEELKKKMRQAG